MKFDYHYEYKKDKRGHQHTTCIFTSKKGDVLSTGKIIRYHKDDHNRMYAKAKTYTIAYENLQRRLQKPVRKKFSKIHFPQLEQSNIFDAMRKMIG